MKLVFFGTPAFAVPSLRALRAAGHEIPFVVTQPDRPASRGRKELAAPPVKLAADGLPLLQPEDVNADDVLGRLRLATPDVLVVVAFGQKMGPSLLSLAPRGAVNGHASLLPSFRGASPIASAILKGKSESGVTIMRIAEKMDTGATLLQGRVPIGPEDTTDTLEARLADVSALLLVELLSAWQSGRDVPEVAQDDSKATYARKLRKEDGLIDWTRLARRLDCHVRGMFPWPVAFTFLHAEGKPPLRLAVLKARPSTDAASAPPGTILGLSEHGLRVATGEGILDLVELQPENRRAMDARSFQNGFRVKPGDRFGPQ